jgi:MFS family permease
MYPIRVLDLKFATRQVLQGVMRTGQLTLAPSMGRLVDRWGNRPVMLVSQLIVATGPLFFFFATRELWWLVIGAYVVWSAYAGLNVGLDTIKLKLAPPDNNAPHLAAYYVVGDLVNGATTIFGGWVLDHIGINDPGAPRLYAILFTVGFLARTLGVFSVAWLREPGARRLRELV